MSRLLWCLVGGPCVGRPEAASIQPAPAAPTSATSLSVTTAVPLTWVDPDTGWVWEVDAEIGLVPPS